MVEPKTVRQNICFDIGFQLALKATPRTNERHSLQASSHRDPFIPGRTVAKRPRPQTVSPSIGHLALLVDWTCESLGAERFGRLAGASLERIALNRFTFPITLF